MTILLKQIEQGGQIVAHPFFAASPYIFTHFIGKGLGEFGVANNGSGSGGSFLTGASTGSYRINRGTATGGRCSISGSLLGSRLGQSSPGATDLFRSRFYLGSGGQAYSAADYSVVRAGFMETDVQAPAHGVFFLFNFAQSPYWQLVAASSGVQTVVNTAISPDFGTAHDYAIAITSGGAGAIFYRDNVLLGEISSNIPKSSGQECGGCVVISHGFGATPHHLSLDHIGYGVQQSVQI